MHQDTCCPETYPVLDEQLVSWYIYFDGYMLPDTSCSSRILVDIASRSCTALQKQKSRVYRPRWMLPPDWLVDSADTTTSRQFCETGFTGYRYGNVSSSNWQFLLSTSFVVHACLTSEASALFLLKSVDGWDFVKHNEVTYSIRASHKDQLGTRSFRVAALQTLNSLPVHLHSPTISRDQFRIGLRSHMFKCANTWELRTIEEWTNLLIY